MSIFRVVKDKNNPYVMINKYALEDKNLSWKAKGVLTYLLSLPDDWQIYESEIKKHAKDGRDSLAAGIKELIENGYINRERIRDEKGHLKGYEYQVFEVPTYTGFSDIGFSDFGKPVVTNNNLTNNDLTNNIYVTLQDDGCNSFLAAYLSEFKNHFSKNHMQVTQEQKNYICYTLQVIESYDIDIDEFTEQVKCHFEKLPASNNGNILAFLKACFRYFNVDLERAI